MTVVPIRNVSKLGLSIGHVKKFTSLVLGNSSGGRGNRGEYFSGYAAGAAAVGAFVLTAHCKCCRGDDESSLSRKDNAKVVAAVKEVCPVQKGTTAYIEGYRVSGNAKCVLVARPTTFREAIDALQVLVDNGIAIIPQGANTGLTGGSVPRSGRPFAVISMRDIKAMSVLKSPDGADVKFCCSSGYGIFDLAQAASGLGVESHSVLGSIFLNPSVGAGLAFSSGGTQVRKGPVYTERVLYARVNANGKVEVVNDMGIKTVSQDELFNKIESGSVTYDDLDMRSSKRCWDDKYAVKLTKNNDSVTRYNADISSPSDAVRSEGKLLVLASVHQAFESPKKKRTLWLASEELDTFAKFRRQVVLGDSSAKSLPASCEYMDRASIDINFKYGAFSQAVVVFAGMGSLNFLLNVKKAFDKYIPFPLTDTVTHFASMAMPKRVVLPKTILNTLNQKHFILMDMCDYGGGELDAINTRLEGFQKDNPGKITVIEVSPKDQVRTTAFRFVCAQAFASVCVLKGWYQLSLDYALPKNCEVLPDIPDHIGCCGRMVYGHYACNVIHDDVALVNGADAKHAKFSMVEAVEKMKGRLPSEHGHGTVYEGPEDYKKRLQMIDPMNIMNPGVAGLSQKPFYR